MHFLGVLDRKGWRRSAAPHAPGWHGALTRRQRWQRSLARSCAALIGLRIPHGIGSSAAALLVLASVSYGTVRGGHWPEIVGNVQDLCDDVARAIGFGISEVALTGEHELGRDRVLSLAGITHHSSLLFLDPEKTRERLVANPWIAEATVLKLYPGRLRIDVKERKPFALWQKDGNVYLIADDGTVLESAIARRFAGLPLVVGKGAERAAPQFIALMARYPSIAKELQASVFVAQRRWDLYLKNDVVVSLPELAPERALEHLIELDRDKQLLSRDIVAIDFRLPDRVTVRQSDAAAAAREAALKAAAKAKKKKGGEA
jgi:cell division protein FtsQ